MQAEPARRQPLALLLAATLFIGCGLAAWGWSRVEHSKVPLSFAGTRVVFISGDLRQPYGRLLAEGAHAAQRDLGCQVSVVDSGWESSAIIDAVRQAIREHPDAICLLGHPGDQALEPLAAEAASSGIVLTALNVDLPAQRALYADRGFGYVGNQQRGAGQALADACLRRFPPQPGDQAMVIAGPLAQGGLRGKRVDALINRLNKGGYQTNHRIWFVDDPGTGTSRDEINRFADELRRHPNLRIIVCDDASIAALLADPLADSQRYLVCFDLTPAATQALIDGKLLLVGDQQPFLQGYLPVVQACLSARARFAGVMIDTNLRLIDRDRLLRQPLLASTGTP